MNPEIIKLEKLLLVGVGTLCNNNDESGAPSEMWEMLMSNSMEVSDRINETISYGVLTSSQEMESKGTFFYMAGFEVSSFKSLSAQMSGKLLPANEYAVFEYKGAISPELSQFIQSIKEWLTQSEYVHAGLYCIERLDHRFPCPQNPDSVLEILIPVAKAK